MLVGGRPDMFCGLEIGAWQEAAEPVCAKTGPLRRGAYRADRTALWGWGRPGGAGSCLLSPSRSSRLCMRRACCCPTWQKRCQRFCGASWPRSRSELVPPLLDHLAGRSAWWALPSVTSACLAGHVVPRSWVLCLCEPSSLLLAFQASVGALPIHLAQGALGTDAGMQPLSR